MNDYTPDSLRPAPADHDLLLDCPTCGLPAEITDRFTLNGAPLPVEHVKLVCIQRHWYTLPLDQLVWRSPAPDRVEGSQVAP
ncbi:MAG: hypothetical protein JO304_18670 [Solirubrobacterales bacterium]|nr:hypothetical protein [Solirubrobacterales bacterium]